MAIQTQGFQVRNMPVYSPVNPNLVAFNPTQITNGMGQAFQLAQQYEQLKASKALQAEAEATRQARIAQQNALAEYDVARTAAALPTLAPRAELDLGRMRNEQALLAPELAAKTANLAFNTERDTTMMPTLALEADLKKNRIQADLSKLGPVTQAEIDQAKATSAAAQNELALSGLKRETLGAQLMLGQKLAQLQYANAEPEAFLSALKVAQQLGDAKTDAEYKKALRDAELELKKSQTEENKAQAAYALGLGRQAMGQQMDPEKEAREIQNLIAQLEKMKVGDNKRALSAYLEETYKPSTDPNTAVGEQRKNWILPNPERDPIGDFYAEMLQSYRNRLKALKPSIVRDAPATASGKTSTPPTKWIRGEDGVLRKQ